MFESKKIEIDVSDFQKVLAVAVVMMQAILSFALANSHSTTNTAFLGTLYVIIKYTAPMFIFVIVYNMVKTSQYPFYWESLKEGFFELVIPYFLWATVYFWPFPTAQQQALYMDCLLYISPSPRDLQLKLS